VTSGLGFETVNAVFQSFKSGDKGGDIGLELNDSLGGRGIESAGFGPVLLRKREVQRGAQKMGKAGFTRAGLAREDGGKGTGGLIAGFIGDGAGGQSLQSGLDSGEVVEGVETVGAAAEFAGSLRTAEHEEAKHGGLVATEIEDRADPMLVLGDASVADWSNESEVFKGMERLANLFFAKVEDGVAAGALVACAKQSIEREGVVLWRGDLFFDERAEDAELGGIKLHGYKVATGEGALGRPDYEETICGRTSCYFSMKIKCARSCRMS
jgi:hypothetical protein